LEREWFIVPQFQLKINTTIRTRHQSRQAFDQAVMNIKYQSVPVK